MGFTPRPDGMFSLLLKVKRMTLKVILLSVRRMSAVYSKKKKCDKNDFKSHLKSHSFKCEKNDFSFKSPSSET